MFIVDAHEDIAWNVMTFGRDYTLSANQTRKLEASTNTPEYNDDTMLGWDDYQRGEVGLVCATLFASPLRKSYGEWDHQCYSDARQAALLYHHQLDVYHRLSDHHPEKFRLVLNKVDVQQTYDQWQKKEETHPVGLVILMEGAEAIADPDGIDEWWHVGVRIIGPAWAGTPFCGGTMEPGPLTKQGYALLDCMSAYPFILDVSHMDEKAVLQALDYYPGSIVASHANVKALLKGLESNRHLSDRVIKGIIEREGVIGLIPINVFLKPGWKRGDRREEVGLSDLIKHIDYICQVSGSAYHVGIGTDFDGGWGLQSAPHDLDTIADLQKLKVMLTDNGYNDNDIRAILGLNWYNALLKGLPES